MGAKGPAAPQRVEGALRRGGHGARGGPGPARAGGGGTKAKDKLAKRLCSETTQWNGAMHGARPLYFFGVVRRALSPSAKNCAS